MDSFELPPEICGVLKKVLVDLDLLDLASERASDLRLVAKWAGAVAIGVTLAAKLLTSVVEAD